MLSRGEEVVIVASRKGQNNTYERLLAEAIGRGRIARIDSTRSAQQHATEAMRFKLGQARVLLMGIRCAKSYSFDNCAHLIVASLESGSNFGCSWTILRGTHARLGRGISPGCRDETSGRPGPRCGHPPTGRRRLADRRAVPGSSCQRMGAWLWPGLPTGNGSESITHTRARWSPLAAARNGARRRTRQKQSIRRLFDRIAFSHLTAHANGVTPLHLSHRLYRRRESYEK